MIDYANMLVQHYKDVRARLNGGPPPPAPVALTIPTGWDVIDTAPEPEPEPPDPLASVHCSPDTKRAILPVLDRHGFTWAQIIERNNTHPRVRARAEVYVLLRERGWSYPRIGQFVGGRDHTTVMNSVQRYYARKANA